MLGEEWLDGGVQWFLLYTKPRAEVWAEMNLRRQGFMPLLPLIRTRAGHAPLFPRYLFVGIRQPTVPRSIRGTLGISSVVHCGQQPARVPGHVIAELMSRMNGDGVVHLERTAEPNPLLARRGRVRSDALAKFAAAGFRVKAA